MYFETKCCNSLTPTCVLAGTKNPPGHALLPVDDQVDVSILWMMLSSLVKSGKYDDDDDDTSSTALGLTANGSDATKSSVNHCS